MWTLTLNFKTNPGQVSGISIMSFFGWSRVKVINIIIHSQKRLDIGLTAKQTEFYSRVISLCLLTNWKNTNQRRRSVICIGIFHHYELTSPYHIFINGRQIIGLVQVIGIHRVHYIGLEPAPHEKRQSFTTGPPLYFEIRNYVYTSFAACHFLAEILKP